jgi:hypothetical protein
MKYYKSKRYKNLIYKWDEKSDRIWFKNAESPEDNWDTLCKRDLEFLYEVPEGDVMLAFFMRYYIGAGSKEYYRTDGITAEAHDRRSNTWWYLHGPLILKRGKTWYEYFEKWPTTTEEEVMLDLL